MPIMSAVTAGSLPNKRRIHKNQSPLRPAFGNQFMLDNGSTIDLNDNITGLVEFPHPGARTFTLGTPVYNQGATGTAGIAETPLTRDGDVLTLTRIPHTTAGTPFGTGSVTVALSLAGTHDFDPVPAVPSASPLALVHEVFVFNDGSVVMNSDGSVSEYICTSGWGGDRCADFVFEP